ncbi:MAG: response regulator [Planctomycetota bacterium]|nr:response regulator [Planctomycetota bacterium]
MDTTPVIVVSVACQAVAALLAIRLIWFTGKRWAWGMVAAAILLMVARRSVSLFRTIMGDATPGADLPFELVGLAVSALMLSGMAGMFPVFRMLRDSEQSLRESRRRLEHLNAVLRGIRNIGQLIAKEKDPDRLLHRVCVSLTESRGFRYAWIAILRDSQNLEAVAEAGLGELSLPLRERLKCGEMPSCMRQVLSRADVSVLGDEICECRDCPICRLHCDGRTMAVRLALGDELYGIMVGSLPTDAEIDEEGRSLLLETAEDISIALHGLRLEEERLGAEKGLRLDESRLETLLQLNQMSRASFQEITNFALEEAVRLTESTIGYLAFMNADETELTMHAWSKTAMDQCQIIDKPIVYQVEETGLWGEAVRRRKPVITNDYAAANPAKKGCPEGHVHVRRHMNVPVFDGTRVVVVAGVGNKEEPYGDSDIRQLTLLMQGMWQLIQRRHADEELRKARDELEFRVRERTAELAGANEELKQERYLLHTLMDYLPHNIYFKDAESHFLRINKALANCFGLEHPSEALGKTDLDFFTAEHASQALADEQEIVRTGRPILDKEERETWPDGRVTWASTTKMPLYGDSGKIVGTFGMSRDVTDAKQAAEALRAAKEAAEAASRAKSTFLANMSHEIRTPLNAVIGMTELVLKSRLSAQQREFLLTVRDSGEALLSVINDILDFSKIEAGKLVLDRRAFDLRENLGDTMKSFAIRAHQQGLELACFIHCEVPRTVVGDYSRLRQIVVNLIGNAIKFTENGEVTLEVTRESRPDNDVVLHFTVSDTGVGIPPDKQAAIFEMFEQADASTTRRHSGTGLGLAIASRLVNLMDGRIWVESEVGRGSRFHFIIRLDLAETEPGEVIHPEPACLHGLRVLVVDDNATNRRILDEVLRSWQMAPTLASSAAEAIDFMLEAQQKDEPYRLILTDAHMPHIDGFTLAEQIKRDPTMGSTVVVMLTSGDRQDDPMRCKELGITSYLLKPVKHSELLEAIEYAIGVTAPSEALPLSGEQRGLSGLRILLVEDSLVNQRLAVALLEGQEHQVTVAKNGREALAVVETQQFDLVLMDVQMPEMDGLEATAAIRAGERGTGRHLPIIAMTAHALQGDRERCLEAGMDEYIAKPIRAKELFDAIESLVTAPTPPLAQSVPAEAREEGVNWLEALQTLQGNDSLLKTVVEAALEEIPRLMAAICQAIASSDAAALRLSAHTLKGSLRYFGQSRVCEELLRLEKMGQDRNLRGAAEVYQMLEPAMRRATQCLQDYLQQRGTPDA